MASGKERTRKKSMKFFFSSEPNFFVSFFQTKVENLFSLCFFFFFDTLYLSLYIARRGTHKSSENIVLSSQLNFKLQTFICEILFKSSSHSFFYLSRQESQYEMTGLYSETQDDSSADLPQDTESESLPSTITVTTNYDPVSIAQSVTVSTTLTNPAITTTSITSTVFPDTVIKCHSRQPSASVMDREKAHHNDDIVDDELLKDCGILSCRPARIQKLARIKVRVMKHKSTSLCIINSLCILPQIFVLLLSMLVTLQQALSSGYINSVITTIEKRFDIPSSYSGLIASSYEIGNVITVIFVSYLGSRRHIPVWIGIGKFGC